MIIKSLKQYYSDLNFIDIGKHSSLFPAGAATFSEKTVEFVLNKDIDSICFEYECYRPFDKIDASLKLRLPNYYQVQVLTRRKYDLHKLFIESINYIFKRDMSQAISIYEDNWSSQTLGAKGIGFEYRLYNIEVAQATYFKQFADKPVNGILEISYGMERIDMILKNKKTLEYLDYSYCSRLNSIYEEYCSYDSEVLEDKMNKLMDSSTYDDFLELNFIFNILDSRNYFSIYIKNLIMIKIRKQISDIIYNE